MLAGPGPQPGLLDRRGAPGMPRRADRGMTGRRRGCRSRPGRAPSWPGSAARSPPAARRGNAGRRSGRLRGRASCRGRPAPPVTAAAHSGVRSAVRRPAPSMVVSSCSEAVLEAFAGRVVVGVGGAPGLVGGLGDDPQPVQVRSGLGGLEQDLVGVLAASPRRRSWPVQPAISRAHEIDDRPRRRPRRLAAGACRGGASGGRWPWRLCGPGRSGPRARRRWWRTRQRRGRCRRRTGAAARSAPRPARTRSPRSRPGPPRTRRRPARARPGSSGSRRPPGRRAALRRRWRTPRGRGRGPVRRRCRGQALSSVHMVNYLPPGIEALAWWHRGADDAPGGPAAGRLPSMAVATSSAVRAAAGCLLPSRLPDSMLVFQQCYQDHLFEIIVPVVMVVVLIERRFWTGLATTTGPIRWLARSPPLPAHISGVGSGALITSQQKRPGCGRSRELHDRRQPGLGSPRPPSSNLERSSGVGRHSGWAPLAGLRR